jgi:nitrile hydratase accessory protein
MLEDFLILEGIGAPPMANGEIVFEAPWQSRAFGMAQALCQSGHFTWDEFRVYLIDGIACWDTKASSEDSTSYPYFEIFLDSLAQLLSDRMILLNQEVDERSEAFAARPHGHDHTH